MPIRKPIPIKFEGKVYESYTKLAKTYNKQVGIVSRYSNDYPKLYNYLMGFTSKKNYNPYFYYKQGEIIGDYKLIEFVKKNKYNYAIYKFKCIHCGHEKICTINLIKKWNNCKKCNRKNYVDKIGKIKDNYKIISHLQDTNEWIIECLDCGKQHVISDSELKQKLRICSCKRSITGKKLGKHNNETINGWLIEDTGDMAYNSRNTLYKFTCTNCGKIKYGLYKNNIKCCRCLRCDHNNQQNHEKLIRKVRNKITSEVKDKLINEIQVCKILNCSIKQLKNYEDKGFLTFKLRKMINHERIKFYNLNEVKEFKRLISRKTHLEKLLRKYQTELNKIRL